ncbi:hypothetical protein LSTR_LSTR012242 [Laodelphax striatellus]|uniref:Sulfatase N-terminal domain-containing protein n=1 Tax=Laodelphax striatellus TaxID=195883 RepID=A0A482X7R6_LAOST|nr:hypothetical protein LSTR_LSTR012242 [Laodelphax striatellus]
MELLLNSQTFTVIFSVQNIVLIVVDDLRPALGCYNDKNAHTPYIDELAENSFVFTRAFAQQALCAPSRNSFLTSRRPDSLHLYDFYSYWRDVAGNFTTLPQFFKERGYVTKTILQVKNNETEFPRNLMCMNTRNKNNFMEHSKEKYKQSPTYMGIKFMGYLPDTALGPYYNRMLASEKLAFGSNNSDDQPYSWTEPPFHPASERYKEAAVCVDPASGRLQRNLVCPVDTSRQPGGTLPDLESVCEANKFILQRNAAATNRPFLLAVGLHKPHYCCIEWIFVVDIADYHPLENVTLPANRQRPYGSPTVAWNPWNDLRKRHDIAALNLDFPYQPIPGWSLGEHGEWSKFSNYEVATRVPFILKVPQLQLKEGKLNEQRQERGKQPRMRNELVELVDLFPTLVELAGFDPLERCSADRTQQLLCTEGTSLVPLLTSNNASSLPQRRAAFSQYPRPGLYASVQPDSDRPRLAETRVMGYSMRTARYRYTEWVRFQPAEGVRKKNGKGGGDGSVGGEGGRIEEIVRGRDEKPLSIIKNRGGGKEEIVEGRSTEVLGGVGDDKPHIKRNGGGREVKDRRGEVIGGGVGGGERERGQEVGGRKGEEEGIGDKPHSNNNEIVGGEGEGGKLDVEGESGGEVRGAGVEGGGGRGGEGGESEKSGVARGGRGGGVGDRRGGGREVEDRRGEVIGGERGRGQEGGGGRGDNKTHKRNGKGVGGGEVGVGGGEVGVEGGEFGGGGGRGGGEGGPDWTVVYASELYDHAIDPEESMNLADRPQLAEIRRQLSKQLRQGWRHSLPQ